MAEKLGLGDDVFLVVSGPFADIDEQFLALGVQTDYLLYIVVPLLGLLLCLDSEGSRAILRAVVDKNSGGLFRNRAGKQFKVDATDELVSGFRLEAEQLSLGQETEAFLE